MANANSTLSRRSYKPDNKNRSTFAELPFVYMPRTGKGYKHWSRWKVTPASDYVTACRTGKAYAAHFIQALKDNPDCVGMNMLGKIASDINFSDESDSKGYWVGFFSYLERFIEAGASFIDVFDDMDRTNKHVDAILAAREIEAATEEVNHVN